MILILKITISMKPNIFLNKVKEKTRTRYTNNVLDNRILWNLISFFPYHQTITSLLDVLLHQIKFSPFFSYAFFDMSCENSISV